VANAVQNGHVKFVPGLSAESSKFLYFVSTENQLRVKVTRLRDDLREETEARPPRDAKATTPSR